MSTMNDFTYQILARQRHDDFVAEVANDRLVRIAKGARPSWRKRVFGINRAGAARPTHTARPAQAH